MLVVKIPTKMSVWLCLMQGGVPYSDCLLTAISWHHPPCLLKAVDQKFCLAGQFSSFLLS